MTISISKALFERFDVPGPRYTSYPTADRFVEAFGAPDYTQALAQRRASPSALSLYVHLPFCESLCYYCACNTIITKHHDWADRYLDFIEREIDLLVRQLGPGRAVSQLHLGGGSPTFLSNVQLERLMMTLRQKFSLLAGGEYAIEIDPRTVDVARLAALAQMGFNRLSFGVQDFDPAVQKAVHRTQSTQQVFELVAAAQALGFESVNVDLIYGLPLQTQQSFGQTLKTLTRLRPDRIALYSYAHLPERFKAQRRIADFDLPAAQDKIEMLRAAQSCLLEAGYLYVGMDHFALPSDTLAVAKRQGRLHRNFQGYSTQPECDLLGLGVSAISRVGGCYSQNAKTLDDYYAALQRDHLPVVRGLVLSRDDLVRRAVIMALMCQGQVQFESIELAWLIDFKAYFSAELETLSDLAADGLLTLHDRSIEVSRTGWFFVRAVAMVFDKYLQVDRRRAAFSKLI